jgi:hypothetical protein
VCSMLCRILIYCAIVSSAMLLCFKKCFVIFIVSLIGRFVNKSFMSKAMHPWRLSKFS